MDKQEKLKQISELTRQISKLPKGYISKKTIGGKTYYYHQWSENGTKQGRYLKDEELVILSNEIDKRKELQKQLSALKKTPARKRTKRNEVSTMKCLLMHKRIPVADIEIDDVTGFIQKIGNVYAAEHLPIGITTKDGMVDRAVLNHWWTERSIPASRSGVREALDTLKIADTKMLLVRCYGLSLSDQYWICPEGSDLKWENINFFTNAFSDDIGDVLFGTNKKGNALNFSSPDNTSDGFLKKRWKIIDGKRCLVKGGSNPFRQQPFNEVIAAGIMERLGVEHIPYRVTWNKNAPYSVCEDFVNEDTELIPAYRIFNIRKQGNSESVYQHFVNCCEELGIKDVVPFLDRMIAVDYIIANEDRHLNNFGALRNAETLEWIGMAPIYDSGSSLGYDLLPSQMKSERDVTCKPFKNHHMKQLELITSLDWLDFSKLSDVKELIYGVLSSEDAREYIDENRIEAIVNSTLRRIDNLSRMAIAQRSEESSTEDDVSEDVAEKYGPTM